VKPRTSRGITNLLLPNSSWILQFLSINLNPSPPLLQGKEETRSIQTIVSIKINLKNYSLISFVFEINQTIQTTNHQRPCTTTQEIKKAHSNCQSVSCPDRVSFPALSQIDPQIPLLVCHSVNFFKFRSCDYTPPRKQSFNDFSAFYLNCYT
jgi:hypothetical protein